MGMKTIPESTKEMLTGGGETAKFGNHCDPDAEKALSGRIREADSLRGACGPGESKSVQNC